MVSPIVDSGLERMPYTFSISSARKLCEMALI